MSKPKSKKNNRIEWYLKRIQTMSVPELSYRIGTALKKKYDRRFKSGYFPKGEISDLPKVLFHTNIPRDQGSIDTYSIFGTPLNFQKPINWHLDIHNQKEFPKKFSFGIDTRSGKNGNVKVVWEVNRMQYLIHLCTKFKRDNDKKCLHLFMQHIRDWNDANPYLQGVNWYSNIEVNIRIINWVFCWETLDANSLIGQNTEFKKFTQKIWLPLIELHAAHAFRYESKYSSSNNHLIAEASGLFIAGCYWPFKNSTRWINKGQRILEREISKQHSENGINREEASEYIQFITDFFLIALLIGERTGNTFSERYKNTLKKIFYYIYTMMDMSGHVPYYGDDDDGKVISPSTDSHFNNFQSLLTTASILFNEPKFKQKGKFYDIKNVILFGPEGKTKFEDLAPYIHGEETALFKEEGHFFIKNTKDNKEVYLHVDVAPLGYLSIAAHGHADALSFFLHIDGKPYVIDVGTYTYHSYPDWRAYFKGTLAHNTVRVDGLDQAKNGGPCLWVDHFKTRLLETEETENKVTIRGSHNAYDTLGVEHLRSYFYDKTKESITIIDELKVANNEEHTYELPLHFHPEITINQVTDHQFEIQHPKSRKVSILLDKILSCSVVKGSQQPILGWYSPSFLQKEPTSVLYSTVRVKGSLQLTTEILVHSHEK